MANAHSKPTYIRAEPFLTLKQQDTLYVLTYYRHAYSVLCLWDERRIIIADGENLFLESVDIQRGIKARLYPIQVFHAMRFENQSEPDHCGSSFAAILTEMMRLYHNNTTRYPERVTVSRSRHERIKATSHKEPGQKFATFYTNQ